MGQYTKFSKKQRDQNLRRQSDAKKSGLLQSAEEDEERIQWSFQFDFQQRVKSLVKATVASHRG